MFGLTLRLLPFLLSMALNSAGDNTNAGDGEGQGDGSSTTGDATGNSGGSEPKTFTQEDLNRIIANEKKKLANQVRDEVRNEVRQELETEAQRKAREEAEEFKPLYEAEKEAKEAAEKKVGEVADGFRRRLAKVEIEKAAVESRLAAPKLAYRLIDFDKITFNDEDEPTNVTDLVKQLATDQPDLVKPATNRDGSKPVPNGDNVATTKDDYKNKYLNQAGVQT